MNNQQQQQQGCQENINRENIAFQLKVQKISEQWVIIVLSKIGSGDCVKPYRGDT